MINTRVLKVLRAAKGLSLEQVGALTQRTPSYWSAIERGKRNLQMRDFDLMAKILGVTPNQLFGLITGDPNAVVVIPPYRISYAENSRKEA